MQPSLTRHHLEQVQSSKSGKVSHLLPPSAASCHRRRLRNADVSSLFALGGSCRASIVVTVRKGELQQMASRLSRSGKQADKQASKQAGPGRIKQADKQQAGSSNQAQAQVTAVISNLLWSTRQLMIIWRHQRWIPVTFHRGVIDGCNYRLCHISNCYDVGKNYIYRSVMMLARILLMATHSPSVATIWDPA